MKVTIPGYTAVTGSPISILKLIRDAKLFTPADSLQDYIEGIREAVKASYQVELNITGSTVEERAESLLRAMGKELLILIEEEVNA